MGGTQTDTNNVNLTFIFKESRLKTDCDYLNKMGQKYYMSEFGVTISLIEIRCHYTRIYQAATLSVNYLFIYQSA